MIKRRESFDIFDCRLIISGCKGGDYHFLTINISCTHYAIQNTYNCKKKRFIAFSLFTMIFYELYNVCLFRLTGLEEGSMG